MPLPWPLGSKDERNFNFHNDRALHDLTPEAKKWYSNLGGDAVAVVKMAAKASTKGFAQAAKETLPALDVNDPLTCKVTQTMVETFWGSMLHPPHSYLGHDHQYRTADGSGNNILNPSLGKAGLPYAKSIQGKRPRLDALPDPGDLFDLLMARDADKPNESESGISSMLLYHATIIIHDIFRTSEKDKNISDTSSYLDLTPLYGNCQDAQNAVRDGKRKKGLLKPDTFAEHRLLNQPPGVCAYLIMYNRFHNYVAEQLLLINENSRFSIPASKAGKPLTEQEKEKAEKKQDEDLFQTARLITCGMYIQISIHDYLRCLMTLHQFDTAWTMEPRREYASGLNRSGLSRGEGNMVSAEFNVLYRFHSPISLRDAEWSEQAFKQWVKYSGRVKDDGKVTADEESTGQYISQSKLDRGDITVPLMRSLIDQANERANVSWSQKAKMGSFPERFGGMTRPEEGAPFRDSDLVTELTRSMEDPIYSFGSRNIPKIFRSVEILGIIQARDWELATLNEFREFFGLSRHKNFEDITADVDVQNALRDLYQDPDMVELYPGLMCEGDKKGLDPGVSLPGGQGTALWRGVFSDAVTLVRSDRFYTIDWNISSLTSWGFSEVQSNDKVNKGSVFHRLFQRAFPGHFKSNSIHMWQPFYTPAMNVVYAQEQDYTKDLTLEGLEYNRNTKLPAGDWVAVDSLAELVKLQPKKLDYSQFVHRLRRRDGDMKVASKPLVIDNYTAVRAILDDTKNWIHPGISAVNDIPNGPLRQILTSEWDRWDDAMKVLADSDLFKPSSDKAFVEYFVGMSKEIRERQQRNFSLRDTNNGCYQNVRQLDIVKEYAMPVVTRFFVDFLGVWDQVKSTNYPNRQYTEAEIYEHLENCQNYQSWDSDETRVWERRVRYQRSIKFLKKLAEQGIAQSDYSAYGMAAWLRRSLQSIGHAPEKPFVKEVRKLAVHTVYQLRKWRAGSFFSCEEVAAVVLFLALEIAHKLVLTFTEIMAYFVDPKKHENGMIDANDTATKRWTELTLLSNAQDPSKHYDVISKYALEAQRLTYKLKLARKYVDHSDKTHICGLNSDGDVRPAVNGSLVLLDVYEASQKHFKDPKKFLLSRERSDYLIYGDNSSVAKRISVHALTGMLAHAATMKNLRVAHDKQGRIHRIQTPDGLERYVSALGDRLLPFPATWNLRFDGIGQGVNTIADNANQGHGQNQNYRLIVGAPVHADKGVRQPSGSVTLTQDASATTKTQSMVHEVEIYHSQSESKSGSMWG